jgi:hypothetical protein
VTSLEEKENVNGWIANVSGKRGYQSQVGVTSLVRICDITGKDM